ncbi:hypothetical protein GCM10029992_01260 [Glycomyces albus]
MLAGLREELDGDGFTAAIDRRRAEFESPAERAERDQARFEGTPKLRLPDFALDSLDSTIGLLRRFKDAPLEPGGTQSRTDCRRARRPVRASWSSSRRPWNTRSPRSGSASAPAKSVRRR